MTPDMITQKPYNEKVTLEVGMTPTNLYYYRNKVYLVKVTMFDHEIWSTLWKVCPIKGSQRLLGLTLLMDFNTLLEVCLVKGF